MANHKNQKKSAKSQKSLTPNPAKAITLCIIGLATIGVMGYLILSIINKPENVVKQKIDRLAKDYYENFFYETMTKSDKYPGNPEAVLDKHKETGLSPISLEQILLLNKSNTTQDKQYLETYCDLSKTSISFFPESPYTKTSYHTTITYSCNF